MTAISSFGTLLKIGDGAGTEVFTTIAEVMDISGPGLAQGTTEVTPQTAPNRARVFIPTLLDGGEVSFDINYEPAGATHDQTTGLIKDMTDGTVRNFQTIFPDAATTTWAFAAIITGSEPSAPVDGALTASVTFKVTGLPSIS